MACGPKSLIPSLPKSLPPHRRHLSLKRNLRHLLEVTDPQCVVMGAETPWQSVEGLDYAAGGQVIHQQGIMHENTYHLLDLGTKTAYIHVCIRDVLQIRKSGS